jgi:hypothetical protein
MKKDSEYKVLSIRATRKEMAIVERIAAKITPLFNGARKARVSDVFRLLINNAEKILPKSLTTVVK